MKKNTMVFTLLIALFVPSAVKGGEAAKNMDDGAKGAAVSVPKKAVRKEADTKGKKALVTPHKVAKEEIGKDAVCPVTGEKFKVDAETEAVSYKGKVYYFCCPACNKPFTRDPEKYLAKKPAAKPAAHAKLYVCPMGEYEGDKPGKCPKCGMDLVEKK